MWTGTCVKDLKRRCLTSSSTPSPVSLTSKRTTVFCVTEFGEEGVPSAEFGWELLQSLASLSSATRSRIRDSSCTSAAVAHLTLIRIPPLQQPWPENFTCLKKQR